MVTPEILRSRRASGSRQTCSRIVGLVLRQAQPLGPRESDALRLVEERPGITVSELAYALNLSMTRARQLVARLEGGRVRREPS